MSFAVLAVLFIAGCGTSNMFDQKEEVAVDLAENKESTGRALVYIDNKPVLYESEFKKYLSQVIKMYPQLSGTMDIDSLPVVFKESLLNKLIDQKSVVIEAKNRDYANDAKFQENLDENIKLLKEHMLIQEFEKRIMSGIKASDADIRKEYDTNKKNYLKAEGGVETLGVKFSDPKDADAFTSLVNGKESEFAKLAKKERSGKYRKFGALNSGSKFVDPSDAVTFDAVKSAALKNSKYPNVTNVTVGTDTWVVCMAGKKAAEYWDYDKIKPQIENFLKSQKFQAELKREMDALKKNHVVKIEKELLEPKKEEEQVA